MLVYYLYKYLKNKKKEGYANIEHLTPAEDAQIDRILFYASVVISLYAAYIFYSCSSKLHPIVRIIGMIIAYYFGILYIFWFIFLSLTGITPCRK